ncbi:21831_t:CDS:2 [Gigaspora rosea]|nr:21831_t:CDS:2 [Gigaspora rosea]
MSFRERSTSPTPSLEEAPCTPQGSSVSTSASTNEINNEPNDKTDNGANNKHFQTISRKKRQATKKKKPSTSATPALTSQRSNASYTHHFFECDKTDNQIQYCKICVKECEGTHKQPYPYTKSNGSTGHLTYHLRDKHNITASNYKEHLDSSQEPIVKVNPITNYITTLPLLSIKRQNELTKEGLKQVNNIHQRLKNIQAFFRLPKQAQRLRETQIKAVSTSSQGINSDNESINPLEVLTDSKTRWNLAYLAWKRISELHPIMRSLAASLQLKPDTMSKKDGEKLDQLCLTSVEKKHFSGSKYPTINLIYPYVRMLKNKYAPVDERGEYVEDWLALIYGPSLESSDDNTYISSSDEDSIPSGGNRKQWQYAHRSRYSQGQGRKRRKRRGI